MQSAAESSLERIGRLGGRDPLTVAAGALAVLLLAGSFTPWFVHRIAGITDPFTATAWSASTLWSAALLLAIAGSSSAALSGSFPRWRDGLLLTGVGWTAAGLALYLWQTLSVWLPGPEELTGWYAYAPPADEANQTYEEGYGVVHDNLFLFDVPGVTHEFGWGALLGLVFLLVALAVCSWMLVRAIRRPALFPTPAEIPGRSPATVDGPA